jgi:MOSC domain-containing protein YiiM
MPREGIFAEIIKGGTVKVGDEITVLEKDAVIKI